jgi:hypothetical protein
VGVTPLSGFPVPSGVFDGLEDPFRSKRPAVFREIDPVISHLAPSRFCFILLQGGLDAGPQHGNLEQQPETSHHSVGA